LKTALRLISNLKRPMSLYCVSLIRPTRFQDQFLSVQLVL